MPRRRSRETATALEAVREKYRVVLRQLVLGQRPKAELAEVVDQSMAELEMLAGGLVALRELTARTSDLVVSRGERLSAEIFCAVLRAAGVKAQVVDALEVVHTEGPFGGAAPELARTDAAVAHSAPAAHVSRRGAGGAGFLVRGTRSTGSRPLSSPWVAAARI